MVSRSLLPAEDIDAICACYALGSAVEQTLVYEGTSSLYRLVCQSTSGSRVYALKVQDAYQDLLSSKIFESAVLSALRPVFRRVPVLLIPQWSAGVLRQPWGILSDDRAISAYEWVDNLPYAGTAEQRRAAARTLGELQNSLDHIVPVEMSAASELDSFLDAPGAGFVPEFSAFEQERFRADQDSGLSPAALAFLQEQREVAREELRGHVEGLRRSRHGLVHAEFTPPNCGYAADGEIRIVFDFEAVRGGLVPLAAALTIATFSFNPVAGARETAARMAEMLHELRSVCPAASPAPGLLLPLVRLAYLDAARRQLVRRITRVVPRWGFLRQDVENLHWLDENAELIADL